MTQTPMLISFVILNYNREDLTKRYTIYLIRCNVECGEKRSFVEDIL